MREDERHAIRVVALSFRATAEARASASSRSPSLCGSGSCPAITMNASEYYDVYPELEHRAGDVWVGLPTFGMLPFDNIAGVVVTPACDLQNSKSASITYLPLIPLRCALYVPPLCHELLRAFNGQLQQLQLQQFLLEIPAPLLPNETYFRSVEDKIRVIEGGERVSEKEKGAVTRIKYCLKALRVSVSRDPEAMRLDPIQNAIGFASFEELLRRLITNAARTDLHFLPDDRQRIEWSAIVEHSLVLFRFPMSAPVEVFNLAQDVDVRDWATGLSKLAYLGSGIGRFAESRPVKRITIRPRYMADLLTRYVSMHVRLGSPDFADETVTTYIREIGEKK